ANLRLRRYAGTALLSAIPIILESIALAILFPVWPFQLTEALLAIIFGTFGILMMGVPFVNPFLKSLRLRADRLAASLVGRESLLQVLEKIKNLHLESADPGGRLMPRPSLEERMWALESSKSQAVGEQSPTLK